ncbi:NADHX dehydratase Ecym_8245 [Eremothecium cymbalariae DBVPG|uniref:ATP-dependent (S)-NAD(P)H-hydrate dehydratase n=1 Tax=Eremothecium cymbalariae (strain CBS 270.75 / DBVPG 7215 / KCTC 17166 / NRRL Y-17582) TaxID=931890 RepID=G8JXF5_ERECY|nr:Hypothetical protein Ecym_8245 [Eremothecium cymbalariae DBVPG\
MTVNKLCRLTHTELIRAACTCIPPLSSNLHKGQSGRVCVIGGCPSYTGAPYFSANAAALMGCDMVHIICDRSAAVPIKSYSPNIMVHPFLGDSTVITEDSQVSLSEIKSLIDRVDTVAVGPGLGRAPAMLSAVLDILGYIAEKYQGRFPVVLDADALHLIVNPEYSDRMVKLLRRFQSGSVIITPNVVEAGRICEALGLSNPDLIASHLQCVTILKGQRDLIYANEMTLPLCNETVGSLKRVGGQGDTLTGCIAAMLAYAAASRNIHHHSFHPFLTDPNTTAVLSCYMASTVVRIAAQKAFSTHGRSMQASDLNDCVAAVARDILPS